MDLTRYKQGDIIYLNSDGYGYIGEIETVLDNSISLTAGSIMTNDNKSGSDYWIKATYFIPEFSSEAINFIRYLYTFPELEDIYYAEKLI